MKRIKTEPDAEFTSMLRRILQKRKNFCWDDLQNEPELKSRLYKAKIAEQGGKCGYCECDLKPLNEKNRVHLDHFYQRRTHKKSEFEWDNIVLSCTSDHNCGRWKDHKSNIPSEQIYDPHKENPREGMTFVVEGDDTAQICHQGRSRNSISAISLSERGEKTISALNLNFKKLRTERRNALYEFEGDICSCEALCREMINEGKELAPIWEEYVEPELLPKLEKSPFASALLAFAEQKLRAYFPEQWPNE